MKVRNWIACVALVMVCALSGYSLRADDADTSTLEGKPAPDFSCKTLDGKDFQLSALKGDVVMIDYWATWCPPCRASLPHVNDISKDADYKSKGLKVFAVNSKEETAKVQKFVDDNKFTFTVPLDVAGEFGKKYLVQGIPTTVIVGRDGSIKKVFIGYGPGMEEPVKKAIESALAEAKP